MTSEDSARLSLVHATGTDATAFLHGQFCGDLLVMPDGGSSITAWCSPGGRVLTTVVAARQGQDWRLVLPASLAESMLKRLRMFVVRAAVTLQPGTIEELQALHQDGSLGPLPAPGSPWDRRQVLGGVPWITAATSGEFLPQELGLERWGGLSYEKGCYPGQEIVARMHFRGAVKRGPVHFSVPPAAAGDAQPGARLELADGKTAGTVLYAAPAGYDGIPLLAIADLAVRDRHELYLAPRHTSVTLVGPCS